MSTVVFDGVQVTLEDELKPKDEIIQEYVETAKQQGEDDQFLVCDIADVIHKYQQWKRLLPRVKLYYAVKCNPDKVVMKVLADLGAFYDCASKNEISKILDLDVNPECIIYTHPHKSVSNLVYAASKNVPLMTFDCEGELRKIKLHYPDAKLVLRLLPDPHFDPLNTFGIKFGCPSEEVREILQIAKELKLNVIGVSFHVGCDMKDTSAYAAALKQSREAFNIAREFGFNMTLLDIGGGFPGKQNTFDLFKEITDVINDTLDDLFPQEEGLNVIAEPGRYVMASAYTTVVNTIGKRVVPKFLCNENGNNPSEILLEAESKLFMYYVNGSVFADFMVGTLYKPGCWTYIPKLLKTDNSKEQHESVLWGFVCTGKDCLNPSLLIPELDIGDWIYFEDMGAYTRSVSSNFNGFETPQIKYHCLKDIWQQIYPKQSKQQKRRETPIKA